MKLALGTAQFGLAYGIAGKGKVVDESEVVRILTYAASAGIECLDTAAGYGDIEPRLARLSAGLPFSYVSKIPALPLGMNGVEGAAYVHRCIKTSMGRLGSGLRGLMFHRQEDLMGPMGPVLWDSATQAIGNEPIGLGVSCYDPVSLEAICQQFPVALAQLPGNALDQRLTNLRNVGCELHLRSAFLQGLLLQNGSIVADRLPAAQAAVENWNNWCKNQGFIPLQAALAVVKGFAENSNYRLTHCVVGVESVAQLDEICRAWNTASPLDAPTLATVEPSVIDPRTWPNKSAEGRS